MTRRGGQLPWGGGSGGRPALYGGPRNSRSYGRFAVLGGIAIVFLLGVWFFAGQLCGGSECTDYYCPSGRDIDPPEGFELVSRIFAYNEAKGTVDGQTDLAVAVELTRPVDAGSSLSFYRYVEESRNWEPITPAVLDQQGKVVSGTFSGTPALMAVMRRNSPGGTVVAYLPHNAPLHPEAAGRVSIVHPVDYKPAADGSVTGELSSFRSDGSFEVFPVISANSSVRGDVAIVENLLVDGASRANHVNQILKKLNEDNVKGVDIAYLDLPVSARVQFTQFIGELHQRLQAENKQLTLLLPSPIKTQNRIDEGAYDWAALAQTADLIKIAPYRDQATYRLAVPEILTYLTGKVPASKLVLTVSPYATETGGESTQVMSLAQAMSIATRVTVRAEADAITTSTVIEVAGTNIDKDEGLPGIRWSPETATVAFSYKQPQGAGSRTIYLENFFSIGFKLELVSANKLGGVAIEDGSNNEFLGNIWTALVPFITSGRPILMQPNPQDLAPRWSVKDNQGTIEDTTRGSARWSTPATAGSYTISLTLSDGVSLFENSIDISVKAKPTTTTPAPQPTAAR